MAEPIFEQCRDVFKRFHIDLNMLYAICASSIYYLILHKEVSTFCAYDFTDSNDVDEFIKTLHWLIDVFFDKLETEDKLESVAKRAYEKGMCIEDVAEITGLSINKVKLLVFNLS